MVNYNINLEGKTVLVTGAAGFIGNNLVKRFFHDVKNIKVIGIDSITDNYDVNIKYERLKKSKLCMVIGLLSTPPSLTNTQWRKSSLKTRLPLS